MNDILKVVEDKLSPDAYKNIKLWFTNPEYEEFKTELTSEVDEKNWSELEDSFYTHIRIGTGGIRGKIGVGPNRINLRTIGEAAQGLSKFIEDFGEEAKEKGVVVSREVRKHSEDFAILCCEVFAVNGIKTFLFDGIRSTPEVSFAVRHLKAIAGVQLTASHNPRTDNGFKFFWTDGGQVVPPLEDKFMQLVLEVTKIKRINFQKARGEGLVEIIGKNIDSAYFKKLGELSLVKSRTAKIAFSPIHSVGSTNALPILKQEGFDVTVVPEQEKPDENFPTAYGDFINPEFEEVLDLPIKLGEKIGADVAICTDPDACRIGAAFKTKLSSNKLTLLTGNEVGTAMLYYILAHLKSKDKLHKDNLVIETYVTTSLISDITKDFGIKIVDDTLVGFKWIGQIVEHLKNQNDFIFAFEESLGYLRGNFIRDKDAAIAAFTLGEMVSWLKDHGKTITAYLDEIYIKYGYYRNVLFQNEAQGKEGFKNIVKLFKALRADPPKEIGGFKVLKIIDRLDEKLRSSDKYIAGVTGDQITFILSKDERTKLTTRPSGTQPQFKHYIQHYGKVRDNLQGVKSQVENEEREIEKSFFEYQDRVLGQKIIGHRFASNW
ncbi:phospho-sugar mutase [Patescibacteria group bacterium]|nr:phospho-sugar mutase [Patescibacteria group bacterium]